MLDINVVCAFLGYSDQIGVACGLLLPGNPVIITDIEEDGDVFKVVMLDRFNNPIPNRHEMLLKEELLRIHDETISVFDTESI